LHRSRGEGSAKNRERAETNFIVDSMPKRVCKQVGKNFASVFRKGVI